MFGIYKKEIKTFFNTLEGYVAILIFFTITTLLLWFIPSEYNIFENNKASLLPLFVASPFVLLLLIPSITMKMISVEMLENTTTILLSKPIRRWEIIISKFLASCTIGIAAIIPTCIFIYSVYQLSEPKGNIDVGEIVGSYIGLIMLITTYSSIGIFSSTISKNSMISFILTVIIIILLLFGFDIIIQQYPYKILDYLSMMQHYESLSRGVIDSRDIIYFLSLNFCFLYASIIKIEKIQI